MDGMRDIILAENEFIWNGGSGSGWWAPPKGTHIPSGHNPIYQEIAKQRREMYSSEEEFEQANNWLRGIYGGGGDPFKASRLNGFNPEKEIEFSRSLQEKEGSWPIFRYQDNPQFKSDYFSASRWSTDETANASHGNYKFKSLVTPSNILVHPLVLYSANYKHPDEVTVQSLEWEYIVANKNLVVERLNSFTVDKILNAWDESRHPRDKKGRFTFVIKGNFFGKSTIGGKVISQETISDLRKQIQDFAAKSQKNAESVERERQDSQYYQNGGYRSINDELRSGSSVSATMCEDLDNSCRFSSSEPFQVFRGESSFSNNWSGVKAGDEIPDGLTKSFVSTSTDANVADKFATHDRMNLGAKIYETSVTINVPTSQRFGIPNVYDHNAIASQESEILLPYGIKGKVSKFTETTKKVGKDTIIQQSVMIDLE